MFSKKRKNIHNKRTPVLNENSPFAVQEAYKALRTNLIFSTPGDQCKVIIVTSSVRGEGKSTTAVNLAVAFAQNKSKVLLLDCDLRLPTVWKKMKVKNEPGLTDALVGLNGSQIEIYAHPNNAVHILPAGTIPPNPTELLGSEQMEVILQSLKQNYEYIIIDTPPVNEVADTTILSRYASGIVLVTRQNLSTTRDIGIALKKLQFVNAKILGFVLNGANTESRKSYKKKYGYGYGYGYADLQKTAEIKTPTANEKH